MSKSYATKRIACLLSAFVYACAASALVSGSAALADTAAATAACDTEFGEAEAAAETANGAADAADDALSVGILPVVNAGWDGLMDQENMNLGTVEAYLSVIQKNVCNIYGVVGYAPGASFLPILDLDLSGTDTTPDPGAIPAEVEGIDETLASEMARTAAAENDLLTTTAEGSVTTDPERKLTEDQMVGLENEEGTAMQGIANDKLIQAQTAALKDRIKTSANMQDLLATEGVVQVGILTALRDMNKNLELSEINEAQSDLNKQDEQQAIWDDRSKTAIAMAAFGVAAAAAAAADIVVNLPDT